MSNESTPEFVWAYSHSSFNQKRLTESRRACFHCLTEFDPAEISEWIDDSEGYIAVCPLYGMDSIKGEASGYSLDEEFIKQMHGYWPKRIKLSIYERHASGSHKRFGGHFPVLVVFSCGTSTNQERESL